MTRRRIIYITDTLQDALILRDRLKEHMTVETFCVERNGRDYHITAEVNQPVYAIALAFCRGYAIGKSINPQETT